MSIFKLKVTEKIKELAMNESQIYNADEKAVFRQVLSDKTYVSMKQKVIPR